MLPYIEERFIYKGYPCVVLFMPGGYRCGYVGLPKGSKFYGKWYHDIPIECHGGLTYSRMFLIGQNDNNTYWIGFDCGHFDDGIDIEKINEYFKDDEEVSQSLLMMRNCYLRINEEHVIRTLDYVKDNCKQIVEQIIKLENEE